MRLMTANLWNGRADPASLRHVLDDVVPDVLVAQEVGFADAEVIEGFFPHGFVRGAYDITGRAFAARKPIDVETVDLPLRPLHMADIDGVVVLGVHLANPTDIPAGPRIRKVEVDAILQRASGLERVVVAGDMNATPLWPVYRRLTADLADGVAELHRTLGTRPRPTWSRVPWGPRLLRIDHVLTRGMRTTSVSLATIAGSDHSAVVVDVEPT